MDVLGVDEVFCSICLGILIEPVKLPCKHAFCLSCFKQSIGETSYTCPTCRLRISNWLRTTAKNNLVDKEFWRRIKEQYNDQVRLKLRGEEDGINAAIEEKYKPPSRLSTPGKVGKEFKSLMQDFIENRKRAAEAENSASLELIKKLVDEETAQIVCNRTLVEEDELLARRLQNETAQNVPTSSTSKLKKGPKSAKKSAKKRSGPMDQFVQSQKTTPTHQVHLKDLNAIMAQSLPPMERLGSSCSNDSLKSELPPQFTPIQTVPTTPPKEHVSGTAVIAKKVMPLKVADFNSRLTILTSSPSVITPTKKIHSPYSAFKARKDMVYNHSPGETPRKRLKFDDLEHTSLEQTHDSNSLIHVAVTIEETENSIPLALTKSLRSDGSEVKLNQSDELLDTQDYISHLEPCSNSESILVDNQRILDEQRKIENMLKQEKDDRDYALQLSRQWARDDRKPNGVVKKKYNLRKGEINRGKRQCTLMETFSRMNK